MKHAMRFVAFLFLIVAGFAVTANAAKMLPNDNTDQAPGFSAFRKQLMSAIKQRDARFIQSILERNISYSYAAESGAKGFAKKFDLNNPKAPFWSEFEHILQLGGWYEANHASPNYGIWFPYLHTRDWPDSKDGANLGVVTAQKQAIYRQPDIRSDIVTMVSYELVKLGDTSKSWTKVTTADKKSGWVETRLLWTPYSRRAHFHRVKDRWLLDMYLKGD